MANLQSRKYLNLASLILLLSVGAGCASSDPVIDTSPDAEITFDGLYPVTGSSANAAWARPDFDISQYSKIMLQGVGIEYRPGGATGKLYRPGSGDDFYEITDRQKAGLREIVSEAFLRELGSSTHFTLVNEAAPDVLLIRGGLLDVVSFVPPEQAGGTDIYLSRVAEATLVLEIRDSVTDAILARAVDRRAAEDTARGFRQSNRVVNTAQVRRMANAWGRKLRERLDSLVVEAQ